MTHSNSFMYLASCFLSLSYFLAQWVPGSSFQALGCNLVSFPLTHLALCHDFSSQSFGCPCQHQAALPQVSLVDRQLRWALLTADFQVLFWTISFGVRETSIWVPILLPTRYVTSDKLLNLTQPHFSHLQNEGNHSTSRTRFLGALIR